MKSNESEAFNRVVNRTLYPKQVFIAIAIAVLMVGSAFIVASSANATTPGVQLSGWTLKPSEGWTLGNIKGYNEGDVVPVRMTVTPNGGTHVSITVGFEWGYGVISDPDVRGFDRVVTYPWAGDPDPLEHPFNVPVDPPLPPPPSDGPFSASGGATIVSQTHLALQSDGSPHWKIWDPWQLEIDLDPQLDSELKAGGLLFITAPDQKGASYFPGSSLHVRLLDVNGKKSAEDISINVEEVLSPPSVVLEKFCNPQMTLVGKKMTFLIAWENTGQSLASNLQLWDYIALDEDGDPLLQYVSDSGIMWTSVDPTEVPVPDPDLNPDPIAWVWDMGWTADGTGPYDANPVKVYYLQFEVLVIGWALGEQTNNAELLWSDGHNPDPYHATAHCHFTIIKPMIDIEKWEKDQLQCAAGTYILSIDEQGNPVYWSGDIITYVIRVTNPSPDTPVNYEVIDPVISRELGLPTPGTPIMSGVLDPRGDWDEEEFQYLVKGNEPEPEDFDYMFRNTATVIAWDVYEIGGKVVDSSYWDVDILHPDLSIKKTACSEVAAVGEEIRYTVEVENLGDATLEEFVIYDQMMTDPILYEATQENPDDDLSPHEILILESVNSGLPGHVYVPVLAHIIVVEDVDPGTDLITNKVWIEAWDTQNHYLYREDSVSLTHVTPSIKITKTAVNDDDEEITKIGLSGEVRYKIEVENTGDVGLWWFYWDTFANPAWTPVEKANPIWTNIGNYYLDGCWAGELSADGDGVYCGQVPIAGPGQAGVVAMSIQDTFVGDELYYEVDIFPHDSYWRAGVLLRYDEASGNGYLVHLYEGGVVMYEMNGWMLYPMGQVSMAISSGSWYTLGVKAENIIDSFFDIYVDGVLVLSTSDVSPLDAGEIGLAVWDEGHNAVHVHFDNVLVKDLDGNVLLRDSFEMLEPEEMPPSTPAIPFPVSPALPGGLACYYQARLASGYLAPTGTDVTYYTYEVQDDDPDPLENTVIVLGWITTDGTEQTVVQDPHYFVWDCDDASVRILGWIEGYVYHDYNLDDVEMGFGDSALDGWTVHLYDSTGTILIDSVNTAGGGYFLFDYLPPGAYKLKVDITDADYFSTNPKDLSDPDGVWEDVSVIAGFGSRQDFGMAEYAYLEGYKWNDWNMNRNRDQPGGVWEPYLDGWVIKCAGWEYDELVNGDPPPGVDPHHEQTAITGEDGISGWFQFKVKPGIWTIWEVMPEDDPLTPLIDESAWFQTFPTTPGTHENVEIDEGSTISDKHFGNVPLTTIWGYKYYDKVGLNGVRDEGDIGLEGWTITLDDGNQLTPVLTDVTGRRSVDVMFAIDLSGSLADDIDQIRAAVTNIMAALASAGVDARFGVVSFVDYPDDYSTTEIGSVPETYSALYGYEPSGDYAYQLDQPLTSDTDDVEDVMDSLSIHYGGDGPQDYTRVIHEAWNDASVGWRYCTERVLVLFGDNAAHDSDFDVYGDGTNVNTGGDPGRDEVLNTDDDLDFETEVANAAAHGVHIMSVYIPDVGVSHEWMYMASETGGIYFTLADVGDVPDAILDLIPLGYFVFTGLKPGTYTLGEVEPLGQEDYWYITTPQGQLHITISKPTVPGTKIHQDIGNMRLAKVWGYKFVDEYGGDLANPTYPNGIFDANEWGYAGWPIHWKLVGALVEADGSPTHTMEDIVATSLENERGRYSIMLVPGDYEIWEEVLGGWQATTPWKVWITIPAHPWGSPIVKKLDFGNTRPLSDPEVPFWLESGWNLWSSPVTTDGLTAKGLLAKIGSAAKIVTKYQETTGNYSTYRVNWPDSYDFPIIAGDGYYVYVTTDAFFTLVGDAIGASNIALVAGWNLVGYDKIEPVKASQLLGMVTGCNAKIVTYYDQYTNTYISYRKGWPSAYDFYVVPGRAYFICTDGAGTLVSS